MEVTVNFGESLNIYGIALFCIMGFINGFLMRNIGLYKGIALFFVLPYSLDLLISLNNVLQATLPFLVFAVLGFLGTRKVMMYGTRSAYFVVDSLERFRR